jgi:hypothetical protein
MYNYFLKGFDNPLISKLSKIIVIVEMNFSLMTCRLRISP